MADLQLRASHRRTTHCRKHASARFRPLVPADRRPDRRFCTSAAINYDRTTTSASDGSINRYYDPTTGQFLSVDPLVDATGQPYAYTGDDPVNGVDPLGLWSLNPISDAEEGWNDTGGKVVHGIKTGAPTAWRDVVDVPQDLSYLAYWGAYEAIQYGNDLGCRFGVVGSVISHIATAPLVPIEAEGLAGQGLGSLAKGESVWLEGQPDQPLIGNQVVFGVHFRQLNKDLGLPFLTFPGFAATPSHHINFAW
jgi:RHS repeat-associated protein